MKNVKKFDFRRNKVFDHFHVTFVLHKWSYEISYVVVSAMKKKETPCTITSVLNVPKRSKIIFIRLNTNVVEHVVGTLFEERQTFFMVFTETLFSGLTQSHCSTIECWSKRDWQTSQYENSKYSHVRQNVSDTLNLFKIPKSVKLGSKILYNILLDTA